MYTAGMPTLMREMSIDEDTEPVPNPSHDELAHAYVQRPPPEPLGNPMGEAMMDE